MPDGSPLKRFAPRALAADAWGIGADAPSNSKGNASTESSLRNLCITLRDSRAPLRHTRAPLRQSRDGGNLGPPNLEPASAPAVPRQRELFAVEKELGGAAVTAAPPQVYPAGVW